MNFTVVWDPDAEQELIMLWLAARDRSAITAASHAIEQRLGNDPANEGESRPPGMRITFEPPLGIIFRVDESPYTVRILRVWRVRRRP